VYSGFIVGIAAKHSIKTLLVGMSKYGLKTCLKEQMNHKVIGFKK
jgi:hypothetical protein